MKNLPAPIIATVLVIVLCLAARAQAERLTVVASVFPLFEFAREVAGPDADVRLLLPPGVDPHSWEPKPSDIVDLSRADIFLYTSDRMEPWAATIGRVVKEREIVAIPVMDGFARLRQDPDSRDSEAGSYAPDHPEDPHFWLDLSLSQRAAEVIGRALMVRDPVKGDAYRSRLASYTGRLGEMDAAFVSGLAPCASRKLVTAGHAAYGYLARRYGLEQVSVYGLSPDAEPSPRHLARIIRTVRETGVGTIFSEELMNPRMARVLSQETGAGILILNPAANLTARQWQQGVTFLSLMRANLDALREGLGCD